MKFAIKPRGIGKKPGVRAIEDHYPLAPGETFTVTEAGYSPHLVLSENSVSLRPKTQGELDAEVAAVTAAGVEQDGQTALAADARSNAIFQALQTATPAQISTFAGNRFPAFSGPQQAVIAAVRLVNGTVRPYY